VEQNGQLPLSAQGFDAGETVVIRASENDYSSIRELARVQADDEGRFDQKLTMPDWLTSGSHVLQVKGENSGRQAEATIFVRAEKPWINLSTYSVQPAQRLGFIGGGFQPHEDVMVYLEPGETAPAQPTTQALQTAQADPAGNLTWMEVPLPMVKPGAYCLLLEGRDSHDRITRTLTVEPLHPLLELSPWSGPPGTKVDLNGRGFMPGEKISVYVNGSSQPALTFEADQYGQYWGAGPVSIPQDLTQGKIAIKLEGEQSRASVTQDFAVVAPHPWAELNVYSGAPGTPVLLSGGGFAAKEKVSIHIGDAGAPTVGVGETDSQGRLWSAGPATVPADASKSVAFVLVGESSGATASTTFEVITFLQPGEAPYQP